MVVVKCLHIINLFKIAIKGFTWDMNKFTKILGISSTRDTLIQMYVCLNAGLNVGSKSEFYISMISLVPAVIRFNKDNGNFYLATLKVLDTRMSLSCQ